MRTIFDKESGKYVQVSAAELGHHVREERKYNQWNAVVERNKTAVRRGDRSAVGDTGHRGAGLRSNQGDSTRTDSNNYHERIERH